MTTMVLYLVKGFTMPRQKLPRQFGLHYTKESAEVERKLLINRYPTQRFWVEETVGMG